MTSDALNQEILQVSSQLLEKSRQAQQEQERAREIADSLSQLPQQQTDARRQLNEVERRVGRKPAIRHRRRRKIWACRRNRLA
jgi:potassium efflux system protein